MDRAGEERGHLPRTQVPLVLAPAAIAALASKLALWILRAQSKAQPRHLCVLPSISIAELQAQGSLGLFFSMQSSCTVLFAWRLPKQLLIQSQRDTIKRLGECTNSI